MRDREMRDRGMRDEGMRDGEMRDGEMRDRMRIAKFGKYATVMAVVSPGGSGRLT